MSKLVYCDFWGSTIGVLKLQYARDHPQNFWFSRPESSPDFLFLTDAAAGGLVIAAWEALPYFHHTDTIYYCFPAYSTPHAFPAYSTPHFPCLLYSTCSPAPGLLCLLFSQILLDFLPYLRSFLICHLSIHLISNDNTFHPLSHLPHTYTYAHIHTHTLTHTHSLSNPFPDVFLHRVYHNLTYMFSLFTVYLLSTPEQRFLRTRILIHSCVSEEWTVFGT